MPYLNSFWHIMWTMFWLFAFFAYLVALWSIIGDLFRDRDYSGWAKAIWVIFLIFVPFLTAMAYVLFRGKGMAERSDRQSLEDHRRAEEYIREVAGSSTADELSKLQTLRDAGTITDEEFRQLKDAAIFDSSGKAKPKPVAGGLAGSSS